MPSTKATLSPEQMHSLAAGGMSYRDLAKHAGVSHVTALRTVEKFKDKLRQADEFKGGGATAVTPPWRQQITTAWDLATIRAVRDEQLLGRFRRPVAMAKNMRTDDALYVAYHTRLAPQASVLRSLVPAAGVRGKAVQKKALSSIQTPGSVLMSIHGTLADHGIAVGYIEQETSDDGSRVDFRLTEWPLEHVQYNPTKEILETAVRFGPLIPITHGDGRWVVFKKFATMPWCQEAAVLPGAFVWASHATTLSDWNQSSAAHGMSKLIGELPAGVPIGTKDALSPEAAAFLTMLQNLVSGNAAAGIRPAGSKTDFESDMSTAWQIFSELATNREKAAARIYLGTDAILGSVGGAPGIDIAALFALASSKLQGDFECIEQALRSGVYEPWTAINEGDSRYAPWLVYKLPDSDAIRRAEEQDQKRTFLFNAIQGYKDKGLLLDQPTVDMLARDYGVVPAPKLAPTAAGQLQVPDALLGSVFQGREAREAYGLAPFGDVRDGLSLDAINIVSKGRADAQVAQEKAAATVKANAAVVDLKAGDTSAGAPSADAQSADDSERLDRLFNTLENYKAQGMQTTQADVEKLCRLFGVSVVPVLASGDTKAVPIPLAPTDIAKVVRVGAALRSLGLEPFGDARDTMTITEFDAYNQAKADAPPTNGGAPPAAPPPAPPPA